MLNGPESHNHSYVIVVIAGLFQSTFTTVETKHRPEGHL